MPDNPIETYRNRVAALAAQIDDLARELVSDPPYEEMRRFAVKHGLDDRSTYGPAFKIGDALRRLEHRTNQVQNHAGELVGAVNHYLDRATDRTHYRL